MVVRTEWWSASCRKLPASSIQVEFSAPGPEVRVRLTTAPTTTNRTPTRAWRHVRRPPPDCGNKCERSHSGRPESRDSRPPPASGGRASVLVCHVIATVRPSCVIRARASRKRGYHNSHRSLRTRVDSDRSPAWTAWGRGAVPATGRPVTAYTFVHEWWFVPITCSKVG